MRRAIDGMRTRWFGMAAAIRRGLVGAVACVALATTLALGGQPNIVFMLSDDQGWDGLSVPMAPDAAPSGIFHTPHLERLAARGMRFSNAYAPAPVCSPTRISLQTGKSPAQLHWTKAAPPERGRRLQEPQLVKRIADDEVTIGELLREAGYATAHYGKWHIAGGGPGAHGYDEHDGETGNEHAYRFTDPNPVDIFGMAARAEAFMEKNARRGRPFFIQLSWNALHAADNSLAATRAKYEALAAGNPRRAAIAAITEDLDTGVGRVLDALDRLGLADDTYVIFMSDNGSSGGGRRGGLSGGKGSVWEGGVRVPLIVRGPGIAAGSWCEVPLVGYDLFPTFCAWAGVPAERLPAGIEGGSISSLLARGGTGNVRRSRDELVFHFPHYQTGNPPQSAIRVGDLKLIHFLEDDSVKLFDLARDRGERDDLAERHPDDARRLRERLAAHLAAIGAQQPSPDPDFDPAARRGPERRRGGRQRGDGDGGTQRKARP
jgi:arylsulfatase A